ncbi:hypothetical protein BX666DRAFT_2033169 [Dichotomocladium elegans]|nr:hypothetical protein BX666DRAFT_2033169 [Dichotomocladium elegans]
MSNSSENNSMQIDRILEREADAVDTLTRLFQRTASMVDDDRSDDDTPIENGDVAFSVQNQPDEEMREVVVETNRVSSSSGGVKRAAQLEAQKPAKKRVCRKHDEKLVRVAIDNHINHGMSKASAAESVHMAPSTFSAYVARYRASRG